MTSIIIPCVISQSVEQDEVLWISTYAVFRLAEVALT
jgi:hypothetical protein